MLKDFLDRQSGAMRERVINSLDVGHIQILMSLPRFEHEDGFNNSELNIDVLTSAGHRIEDLKVAELFQMKCLDWVRQRETFVVNESLRGKTAKDEIVRRSVDLRRGGDGSASFKSLYGGIV